MADILNLALPYFGLIFIGFACGKTKGLPESGLAWMNFFLLYVSLPALLFGIMSKTPFSELNNPPFLIATTLATVSAFVLAMVVGPDHRRLVAAQGDAWRASAGAYGNIGYMGPGLALAVLGSKAAAPTALIFCCDSIFLFSIVPLLIALTDREHPSFLHAIGDRCATDRAEPADHVGRRGRACRGAAHPTARRDRQNAFVPAERSGADGAVRAGRHRGAAPVRSRALGSARRDRDQAPDPSA